MPRVSIGLPVFNGENYLGEALQSLLAQTLKDFELIISDNGSEDRTEQICRGYAEQDKRIQYFRSTKNRGASWNHQFVINKAKADYFKLAAHDDMCLPTHLESCVHALDNNPHAVLAYTQTLTLSRADNSVATLYADQVELESPIPGIRYGDLINECPPSFPIFGVVRSKALKSIPLFPSYKGSDRVVITRLALMGPFVEIKQPLFKFRWHDQNASHLMESSDGFYRWWSPNNAQMKVFPECRLMFEHLRSIFIVKLGCKERRQCLIEWWYWTAKNKNYFYRELKQLFGSPPPPSRKAPNMIQRGINRHLRKKFKTNHYLN